MSKTEQFVHTLERMALRREHSGCVTDKGRRWAAAELEALRAAIAALSHAAGQDGEQCRAASGEDAYVIEQMGRLLAEIAVIVNGPEPPMTRWSYHDLPEKVRALSRGVPEVEPFVSCTCHEERQKQLCLNKHRCVRAYPLAAIAAQRKEGV